MTTVYGPIPRHMSVEQNQCVKGQRQTSSWNAYGPISWHLSVTCLWAYLAHVCVCVCVCRACCPRADTCIRGIYKGLSVDTYLRSCLCLCPLIHWSRNPPPPRGEFLLACIDIRKKTPSTGGGVVEGWSFKDRTIFRFRGYGLPSPSEGGVLRPICLAHVWEVGGWGRVPFSRI